MCREEDRTQGKHLEAAGVIAMAAYKPREELFIRQLRSIQAQSITNFRCLISADGDAKLIADLVDSITNGDSRFQVLGFDNRLGSYQNFERVLAMVPADARWVALSDQDDYWYEDKLKILLPHLDYASLAAGQSRVVVYPGGRVLAESTLRKSTSLLDFFVENQFTGGATVFRRDVLGLALPFPLSNSPSQVHDHWLAVCAGLQNGSVVVDCVVQDYVQHDSNLFGEARRKSDLIGALSGARKTTIKFQGSASFVALLRTIHAVGVGWREAMADTLLSRLPENEQAQDLASLYGSKPRNKTIRTIIWGYRNKGISLRRAIDYLAGLPLAPLATKRRKTR